jgi:hypothetical protein
MHRLPIFSIICMLVLAGCAARSPVAPDSPRPDLQDQSIHSTSSINPHRIWGEWSLYFNSDHDGVDVVPRREMRFHLNALKFLESYCADCLKITNIKNNWDGTIDLTIKITHPFKGHPEYTGFDVKGIIMFRGSREYQTKKKYPMYPQPFRASWRLLGDPELLNADGFTYYWSPWYDSGSDMPIFNYWPGKLANGTPSANINGFLNFYSNETRHMFECNSSVSRTYHISLPPGPQEAGYAIDACWEPPLVTPVTKPADDFPITANQPEAYKAHFVVNDGNVITDPYCCGFGYPPTIHEGRVEANWWYVPEGVHEPYTMVEAHWTPETWNHSGCAAGCEAAPADGPPDWLEIGPIAHGEGNGIHQSIGVFWLFNDSPYFNGAMAFDVFEYSIEL